VKGESKRGEAPLINTSPSLIEGRGIKSLPALASPYPEARARIKGVGYLTKIASSPTLLAMTRG